MTADLLRRAASLMRARAEAATPGVWVAHPGDIDRHGAHVTGDAGRYAAMTYCDTDAEHIAALHPAVALALADWLEDAVKIIAWSERPGAGPVDPAWPALKLARTYLNEPTR